MKIFETKEQATTYAIEEFGFLAIETETVNVVKVGPTMARMLKCKEGFAIDTEIN